MYDIRQKIHFAFHLARIFWYLILTIEAVLIVRLVAQVILEVPHAGVQLVTNPIVFPIAVIMPATLSSQVVTFVSMIAYWFVAFVIMKLIAYFRPIPETPLEAAIERED